MTINQASGQHDPTNQGTIDFTATFSEPVIRRLRVAVVDQDRTQTSMTYVQAVDAAPGEASGAGPPAVGPGRQRRWKARNGATTR